MRKCVARINFSPPLCNLRNESSKLSYASSYHHSWHQGSIQPIPSVHSCLRDSERLLIRCWESYAFVLDPSADCCIHDATRFRIRFIVHHRGCRSEAHLDLKLRQRVTSKWHHNGTCTYGQTNNRNTDSDCTFACLQKYFVHLYKLRLLLVPEMFGNCTYCACWMFHMKEIGRMYTLCPTQTGIPMASTSLPRLFIAVPFCWSTGCLFIWIRASVPGATKFRVCVTHSFEVVSEYGHMHCTLQ